jgi:hypothetical protein
MIVTFRPDSELWGRVEPRMRREIKVTSRHVEPVGRSVAAYGAGPPSQRGRSYL